MTDRAAPAPTASRDGTEPATDRNDTIALVARDVDHVYGDLRVLQGASLDVRTGAVTALVGPNGSGKTTLIRILAGLLDPTDGTVDYRGPDAARPIGYLPQQPEFRPGFTARETLAFYAKLAGSGDPDALLERVGLEEAGERRVEALSGGMRRLLGIAQAIVGDPPVVVLDEPASGLDPGMRAHVFDVAAELATAQRAVLLSSHDLERVERRADHVALLDRGRIVQEGSPAALCDRLNVESLYAVYDAVVAGERGTVRVGAGGSS